MKNVINHYDSLVLENNDSARGPLLLQKYMDKWDGEKFFELLDLTTDKNVLEFAVGTGRLAKKVCGGCKQFFGIDISPKTIERANENLKDFTNKNLICADFFDYVFNDRFDIIYSSLTFMHIKDKQKAINKIASLLKPDGRFILSIDKNQDTILDYGTRQIEIYPDNPKDIENFIKTSGMRLLRQAETEFAFIFASVK